MRIILEKKIEECIVIAVDYLEWIIFSIYQEENTRNHHQDNSCENREIKIFIWKGFFQKESLYLQM